MNHPRRLIVLMTALFSGCATHSPHNAQVMTHAPLVGAWRARVQFSSGDFASIKDLQFLLVFHADGTLVESSNYDESPPVPPAYGSWRQLAGNEFEAKYMFFVTKPPSKFDDITTGGGWLPAGYGVLTEHITVDQESSSYSSTMTLTIFDSSDRSLPGGGNATVHAMRIRF
jgi:hypothetical protein